MEGFEFFIFSLIATWIYFIGIVSSTYDSSQSEANTTLFAAFLLPTVFFCTVYFLRKNFSCKKFIYIDTPDTYSGGYYHFHIKSLKEVQFMLS